MSNENSNKKKPGPAGTFKVKLKKTGDDDQVEYLVANGNPDGVTCGWSSVGTPLEFSADRWQEPSTWQRTDNEARMALDGSTVPPNPPVEFKVCVNSSTSDGNWQTLEGSLDTGYKLPHRWTDRVTRYLGVANAGTGGQNVLVSRENAAIVELVPPQE